MKGRAVQRNSAAPERFVADTDMVIDTNCQLDMSLIVGCVAASQGIVKSDDGTKQKPATLMWPAFV